MREPSEIQSDAEQLWEPIEEINDALDTSAAALPTRRNDVFDDGDLESAGERLRQQATRTSNELNKLGTELATELNASTDAKTAGNSLIDASEALGHVSHCGGDLIAYGKQVSGNGPHTQIADDASESVTSARESLERAEKQLASAITTIPSNAQFRDAQRNGREEAKGDDVDDYGGTQLERNW